MRVYLIGVILAFVMPTIATAHGASKAEFARCSAESNEIIRLECFDALADRLGANAPSNSVTQPSGDWKLREEKSPLDDSTNYYLSVDADSPILNRFGRTVTPSLTIRCKENTTALSVWWGVYLGLNSTYVTHRIGTDQAEKTKWALSTKNEHVGKWNGRTSIPFIQKLLGQSKLLLQVTPYGENSVMATFNIGGLDDAIKPLRDHCGW